MDHREKRELRALKRAIKRAGHKHERQQAKRQIAEHPEEAAFLETGFGRYRSDVLNGLDHDATRRRHAGEPTDLDGNERGDERD